MIVGHDLEEPMRTARIAITLDQATLKELDRLVRERRFTSRSRAIQVAVQETVERLNRKRLARECAKLELEEEQRIAEEGFAEDLRAWPEY
jgi:metal-responsive CopG/Arc/MetJ family transcriptional regulator